MRLLSFRAAAMFCIFIDALSLSVPFKEITNDKDTDLKMNVHFLKLERECVWQGLGVVMARKFLAIAYFKLVYHISLSAHMAGMN